MIALLRLAFVLLISACGLLPRAATPYANWSKSGSIFIDTTPNGANLPPTAALEGFPLLVRLHKDFFDFQQAKAQGEDLRFSTTAGAPLAYQIEEWEAADGIASIWVRIPLIKGNKRQELKVHWGHPEAISESSGSAVFNESNGYLSVWHLGESVKDEVGAVDSRDAGTVPTAGIIGPARRFTAGQGISTGEKIAGYPVGSSSHSSEAWIRPATFNTKILAWGNEQAQGKVVMQFRSPPHLSMDCYFSDGNVEGAHRLPLAEWTQVVHTYEKGNARVYVNGVLDSVGKGRSTPLNLKSPARLWIGGWHDDYDFVGEIDEVRISKVARSADWLKLQFENQKLLHTACGPIVQGGGAFSVEPTHATVKEGGSAIFSAQADGAQKLSWILKKDGRETTVAVDRRRFQFDAGRVTNDQSTLLQVKAIYGDEVKTRDIPISVQEEIPEPAFTLQAPAKWDGRTPIEVIPKISNLRALQAKGGAVLKTTWNIAGLAVIKEATPDKLMLLRAQNSGQLTITATMHNGGQEATQSITVTVTEPKHDAWVARLPAPDEQPEDNQFFAREGKMTGTVFYRGTLPEPADSVFLKLYANDKLIETKRARIRRDKSYTLAVKLKAGLTLYRTEFGARSAGIETVRHRATNLVCGDAYLIDGQSNALATDTSEAAPTETITWIRTYGRAPENSPNTAGNLWRNAVWKAHQAGETELGWWGMELAKRLVASQQIPICIINAAVGGTRIDQHQRHDANPTDLATLYGQMLWRAQQARLTHGIRGILWHQGENDQGADGPTGGYGWETYQPLFVEMAADWKQDFPNVQQYYLYQIWPNSCSMGGREGAGDRLREKQRTLPSLYSNLRILSTLGVRPPGGCHFPLAGWTEFARLVQPLLEQDHYGKKTNTPLTAPNLRRAQYANTARDRLTLKFDQPVLWTDALAGQFYLDGEKGRVASGAATGNILTLHLKSPSDARTITYLKEIDWNQATLLNGENGLAALTFCEVPLEPIGSAFGTRTSPRP